MQDQAYIEPDMNDGVILNPQKRWYVRVYQPYIVDYIWDLMVPAKTHMQALKKVAALMRDDTKTIPPRWITKSEYDNDGTDIPSLHGLPGWEVLDSVVSDEVSIKPNTELQMSFVWHSFSDTDQAIIRPSTHTEYPRPVFGLSGVLIAEEAKDVDLDTMGAAVISGGDLRLLRTGQIFWCAAKNAAYRVLWVFANPQ